MKLSLLLVVLIAAVLRANCRDYTDGPNNQASAIDLQNSSDGPLNTNIAVQAQYPSKELEVGDSFGENPNTFDVEHQLEKDQDKQNLNELRGNAGKMSTKQLIKNLKSMENKLTQTNNELKVELKAIQKHQYNITNTNTELNNNLQSIQRDLQFIKINITANEADNSLKLDSISTALSSIGAVITNHTSMLDSLKNGISKRECPRDMFLLGHSYAKQCFKFFTDYTRSWTAANSKCRAEKLEMAEPKDPISLRAYLVTNYNPSNYVWPGAQGDSKSLKWVRGGYAISNTSPLWHPGTPGSVVTTSDYVFLLTTQGYVKSQPNKPFYSNKGTYKMYTLCEFVMN